MGRTPTVHLDGSAKARSATLSRSVGDQLEPAPTSRCTLGVNEKETHTTMKVLVAADMGPGSDSVLRFAAELVKQTGGHVFVVHVISEEEEEDRRHNPGQSQYVDVMLEESKRDLENGLLELGVPQSSITALTRRGKPVDEIQTVAAENDVDALVIGMRRRSRVGKFLLGSDLQELLLSSDRPVIAVPINAAD